MSCSNNVIFLFGPSCSGKSTLGRALQNNLGRQWTYIDRDDLIEQNLCTESTADATLEKRIESIKNKIIVDAQIPWREKEKSEFYFMVLPPLKVLLERDAIRTVQLQRPKERAQFAQEYVIESYNILISMDKKSFNCCFDSSKETVQDEVNTIKSIINYRPDFHIKYFCIAIAGFAFSLVCTLFAFGNNAKNQQV